MLITYKECINLGTFDYDFDPRKFPRRSYSNLRSDYLKNNLSRLTDNIFPRNI